MAFFDELGKKITQGGQVALQKTKDMADVARLNSMIADEEKRINNNYYQIGKLYASLHAADCEGDFVGMIQAIREAESKIADYRQQIQDIRGVKKCEKCGAEVDAGAAFCNACGAPMPVSAEGSEKNLSKCPSCGQMVPAGMRFCTNCGAPMQTVAQQQETLAEAVSPANTCPNCGSEISENTAFCTECGAKL